MSDNLRSSIASHGNLGTYPCPSLPGKPPASHAETDGRTAARGSAPLTAPRYPSLTPSDMETSALQILMSGTRTGTRQQRRKTLDQRQ